jgi:hypothetical protein
MKQTPRMTAHAGFWKAGQLRVGNRNRILQNVGNRLKTATQDDRERR